MGLQVTNEGAWLKGVQNGFADLEITSERHLADLAASISANMRDGAPVMPSEERQHRQATEYGRAHTRKTPGKATIRYRRGRDRRGFFIDVGPSKGAWYLALIEYGTSKMTARPFLRPAIERAVAAWGSPGSKS